MRKLLAFSALVALLLATSLTQAQDEFDWRAYEGTNIRFIVIQGPWIDAVRDQIPAFEEATGITVTMEVLPEDQAWDKIRVEMQAGSDTLDVFLNQTSRFNREFHANGWLLPLDAYIGNPALTNPDFDYEADFLQYSRDAVQVEGNTYAIPTDRVLGPMFFYRRDLLEEYDIEVPTTFEELEAAAIAIHEASDGEIIGIVNRGAGAAATSQFGYAMREFGGAWEDAEGNPTVNTPAHIAAFDWWGRTLRETGAEAATSWDFAETVNEFLQGGAAFTLENGVNVGRVNNPELSNVAGLVGYAPIVRGPAPESVRQTEPCLVQPPFGLSIPSFSQQQEAAWYFIQWMVGKEAQLDYLQSGRVAARTSAWQSEEFADGLTAEEQAYWAAQQEASTFCYPTPGHAPPSIRDIGRARDIIGEIIVTSILGGDVAAAANFAQEELDALRARELRASN